jgi:D-amino-acid dehydrogenase
MNSSSRPHYTVLGAGIVGTSTALALRLEGFPVTLIDREAPGMGASFGNAGVIQTAMPLTVAAPGMMRQLPKYLLDPDSPLSVRWRSIPRLMPFFARLAAASGAAHIDASMTGLQAIAKLSGDAHRALAREAGAENLIAARGVLFVYPSAAAFGADSAMMDLFGRKGVNVERLGEDDIRQMEPALSRDYQWAYHLPDNAFTVDPGELTSRYAARFQELGGELLQNEVSDFEYGSSGPNAVVGSGLRQSVDRLVIALGVNGGPLLRRLGLSLPIANGRGYHLMLPTPVSDLRGPVIDGKAHFAATPMTNGLRLAGTIEFAGDHSAPNWRRADMLYRLARHMLPDLDNRNAVRWMGGRPLTPDSLPVIGPVPGLPNVLLAMGHGQFGMTLGAITGKIIADLAAGRTPSADIRPYRVDRF